MYAPKHILMSTITGRSRVFVQPLRLMAQHGDCQEARSKGEGEGAVWRVAWWWWLWPAVSWCCDVACCHGVVTSSRVRVCVVVVDLGHGSVTMVVIVLTVCHGGRRVGFYQGKEGRFYREGE